MTTVRGLRGATTADSNTRDAILEATRELLEALVDANDVCADDIAAVTFSTTRDLDAEFPAVAARVDLGWTDVAMMCGHEMEVPRRGQERWHTRDDPRKTPTRDQTNLSVSTCVGQLACAPGAVRLSLDPQIWNFEMSQL